MKAKTKERILIIVFALLGAASALLFSGCDGQRAQCQWRTNIDAAGIIESQSQACDQQTQQQTLQINIDSAGIIESELVTFSKSYKIDIRDEPMPIDYSPRQPEWLANMILNFRGYDSHFKFENQLLTLQGRTNELWWPF